MKIKGILIASIFLSVAFVSCKEDVKEEFTPAGSSKVEFTITDGSKEIKLNEQSKISTGYDFTLSMFKAYVSNLTLYKEDSTEVLLQDVALLNFGDDNANSLSVTIPNGNYTSLRIGYGLTPEQNDADPFSFDESHPLSNTQSMQWPMIKYRFVKLEGYAVSQSTSDDYLVSIHPGTDPLYQVVNYTLNDLNVQDGYNNTLHISIDINDLFDGPSGVIDFATDNANQVHMTADDSHIGKIFMENMAAAAKLEVHQTAVQ